MFFWKDTRDTPHEGIGLTRDITVRGVFVFTTTLPPLESDITIKAFIPPRRRDVPLLGMRLRGRVVRVEAAGEGKPRAGFAVAGERFNLCRGEKF